MSAIRALPGLFEKLVDGADNPLIRDGDDYFIRSDGFRISFLNGEYVIIFTWHGQDICQLDCGGDCDFKGGEDLIVNGVNSSHPFAVVASDNIPIP